MLKFYFSHSIDDMVRETAGVEGDAPFLPLLLTSEEDLIMLLSGSISNKASKVRRVCCLVQHYMHSHLPSGNGKTKARGDGATRAAGAEAVQTGGTAGAL